MPSSEPGVQTKPDPMFGWAPLPSCKGPLASTVPSGAGSPWPGLAPAIGKQYHIGHVLPPPAAEALLPQDILPTQALEHGPNNSSSVVASLGWWCWGKRSTISRNYPLHRRQLPVPQPFPGPGIGQRTARTAEKILGKQAAAPTVCPPARGWRRGGIRRGHHGGASLRGVWV